MDDENIHNTFQKKLGGPPHASSYWSRSLIHQKQDIPTQSIEHKWRR